MFNQTKRVFTHKSKSKIFITILCIIGLLFSWSCSCKNRVSDPNETPIDGGIKTNNTITNYIPKTYTATRSGDTLIVVNSDGNGIQQAAKISFQDAKVTSVTMDVGTTGIAADVFKYESGGLTMTAFDSVTTTRQKVTATFSLAPNDSRDKLNNPTETVDIEVVKANAKVDAGGNLDNNKTLGKTLAIPINIQLGAGKFIFMGQLDSATTINENAGKITIKNGNSAGQNTDNDVVSVADIQTKFKEQINQDADIKKYFGDSGISDLTYVSGIDGKLATFTFKVTPLPEYEFAVKDWTIEFDTTEKGGKFGE